MSEEEQGVVPDRAAVAAKRVLAKLEDASLAWLKASALRERAYLFGAALALEAVGQEGTDKTLVKAIMGTLWAQSEDDPFPDTDTARGVAAIRAAIHSEDPNRIADACRAFEEHLDQFQRQRMEPFERAHELTRRLIQSDADGASRRARGVDPRLDRMDVGCRRASVRLGGGC